MTTANRSMQEMPSNSLQPSVPFNADLAILDAAVYGTTTIELTADANLTLTQAQCDASVLIFTDSPATLTTGRDVVFPAHFPRITVYNSTAQTLTLKKSGQTGVTVAAGDNLTIVSGATDVLASVTAGSTAASTSIADAGGYFTGTDVEAALQELGAASAGSTAGRHAIYIPAGAISPSTTGGCAALATIASAANQPDIQSLDFDATTQEYAQFSFRMPKSWDEGTVTFAPVWSHAATTTNFGVVFDLQLVAISNDDTILANFGTAQTSTDTGGTTSDIYIGPESSAITIAGTPAAEDMVFGRLSRVTGNGSDTMAVDARLHGITVYITTSADTDA